MRWLDKPASQPRALAEYCTAQPPSGVGLDYPTFAATASPQGGSRGGELRNELIREQGGICAYTGAGIDERVGTLQGPSKHLKFQAHNEHLKPQSKCKEELEARGSVYGEVLGEDMNHHNIVAALLVEGAARVHRRDLFGASYRGNGSLGLLPTDRTCDWRLAFREDGSVEAASDDPQAQLSINNLNLNHKTLVAWRAKAIATFLEGIENKADAQRIVEFMKQPQAEWLPEYSFAIRQVVQRILTSSESETPDSLRQ